MSLHAALLGLLDAPDRVPPHPVLHATVVADTDLPRLAPTGPATPLTVVTTGGAGQVAGPAAYCARAGLPLAAVRVALRDLDDPAGNARRVVAAVDAARAEGDLDEEVPVEVVLPPVEATYSWLGAADEVAAAELRLSFRTDGVPAPVLAGWFEAALDRETPWTCAGGPADPVGDREPGSLQLLAAAVRSFDGGSTDEVVAALAGSDLPDLDDLARGRRWLTSVGTPDLARSLAALAALGHDVA